jgi:hypothetical protein
MLSFTPATEPGAGRRLVISGVDIFHFPFYVLPMFKPMDQDLARSLLEGQPDVLSAESKKEEELYQNVACPVCYQTGAEKRIVPTKIIPTEDGPIIVSPFVQGRLLPVSYAHCLHCNTDFDPKTGVIRHAEVSMIADPLSDPLLE